MANEVFANDLELACKRADGKSIACFPDPCFSPPSPSAGWILIPYANTAYAKDTSNASKTVFISGKPIMKKDVSFFKTSTGNEPAAGPKGQFTGVKKGKAYFTSWSMNVKVEGENVDRHTDGMTHNHGSKSGNTAIWTYSDTNHAPPECQDECVKIEVKCGKGTTKSQAKAICSGTKSKPKEKDKKTKQRKGFKKKIIAEVKKGFAKKGISLTGSDWKKENCIPLHLIKPDKNLNLKDAHNKLNEAMSDLSGLSFDLSDELLDTFISANWKEGVKQVLIGVIGRDPIEFFSKKYRFGKAIVTGGEIAAEAEEAIDTLYKGWEDAMKEMHSQLDDMQKKLLDSKKWLKDQGDITGDELAEMQKQAAKKGCLGARKCLLEPYNSSTGNLGKSMFSNKGCCPGQTAHHLIPNSAFQEERGKTNSNIDDCKKSFWSKQGTYYTEGGSPTVCVEGINQHQGSHGDIHTDSKTLFDMVPNPHYSAYRNKAITAQKQTFPSSNCSTKCMKSQLDNYYKKACRKDSFPTRKTDGIGSVDQPISNSTISN